MKLRPRLPAKVLKVAVFIAMLATNDDETNMAGLTLPFPANYDAEWGRTPVLRGSSRTRSALNEINPDWTHTGRSGRRQQDWSPAPRGIAACQRLED